MRIPDNISEDEKFMGRLKIGVLIQLLQSYIFIITL